MKKGVYNLSEAEKELLWDISGAALDIDHTVEEMLKREQFNYKEVRKLHIAICALIIFQKKIEESHPDFAYIDKEAE